MLTLMVPGKVFFSLFELSDFHVFLKVACQQHVHTVRVCVSLSVGMEDISPGLMLPESTDDRGWVVVGTCPADSTHADCLHLHLSVPVQHSVSVPLPCRGEQRRQRGHVSISVLITELACGSECQINQASLSVVRVI